MEFFHQHFHRLHYQLNVSQHFSKGSRFTSLFIDKLVLKHNEEQMDTTLFHYHGHSGEPNRGR